MLKVTTRWATLWGSKSVVYDSVLYHAGHIGQTLATPRELALEDYVARRHASGFVAPSYTFGSEVTDDGQATVALKESAGRDELMSELAARARPYDDRRFKYWCYDTPGLVNRHQVDC